MKLMGRQTPQWLSAVRIGTIWIASDARLKIAGLPDKGTANMTSTVSTPSRISQRPLMIVAVVVGILLAGTAAMWAHYGTAVFYEMIVAGIATCL